MNKLITSDYKSKNNLEIFDALFKFFIELKEKIKKPNIRDRADNSKFIDEYLNETNRYSKRNNL